MKGDPSSHGLWEASAPAPPPTVALTNAASVDVAVIGAGFTGTSAALHLAEGGASVAILESGEIGFGASGRNVGLVNAGMWVQPAVVHQKLGPSYGPRLLKLLSWAPSLVYELVQKHRIPCEPVRQGTLHCAVGAAGVAEIRERARQWLELGAPVELLDADRTAKLTGTRAYVASLLDRRAGTIQPLAYVRGLASAAIRAGASIHTNTRVTHAERAGARWQLATSSGGTVAANWVLVATDAYGATDGVWPMVRTEQITLPYFNVATQPLREDIAKDILPEGHGAWDTRPVLSSFRTDAAGRIVVGSVGALRGGGRAVHRAWARRALAKLFPKLQGASFEYEWYGHIGMTSDSLPRLHELDQNVLSFSGFNGRGIAPGTVLGRELARLVLGDAGPADRILPVTPASTARLRVARELAYEIGAGMFHAVDARI